MNHILIYKYNDMVGFFFHGIMNIDFVSTFFIDKLMHLTGPILANNILVVLSILLSFSLSYIFFNKLKTASYVAIVFSFLFAFSNYFIFRVESLTLALYFTFVFPLAFIFLLDKKGPVFMAIFNFVVLSFANYYGFFVLIIIFCWYLYDLFCEHSNFKSELRKIAIFLVLLISLVLFFYSSNFVSNTYLFGKYKPISSSSLETTKVFYRPMGDFYSLSFRPWYFLIPPKSSVYFGQLSKGLYQKIANTKYYLADDYMEEEMGGSYLGWHLIVGYLFSIFLIIFVAKSNFANKKFKLLMEKRDYVLKTLFLMIIILLFSGPPSFTISGFTFYTPSYVLYYVLPVFRTLVRLAVIIYLIVLSINALLLQDLLHLIKGKALKALVIAVFVLSNYFIFAIRVPLIDVRNPPEDIKGFYQLTSGKKVEYLVFPRVDYYSLFWASFKSNVLVDASPYSSEKGLNPSKNTDLLITPEGLAVAKESGVNYLLYYPNKITNLDEISRYNKDIKDKGDIEGFFSNYFGEPLKFGVALVFVIK